MGSFQVMYQSMLRLILILRKIIVSGTRDFLIFLGPILNHINIVFSPSALDLWNNLDQETQNMTSLSIFKRKLNYDLNKPPSHYSAGPRKFNIIYCQLRNEVSNLKHHLFRSHLSESSRSACGDDTENSYHYFYVCPLYVRERAKLFHDLRNFHQLPNLDFLLCGSDDLSPEENINITNTVLQYIAETKRFE